MNSQIVKITAVPLLTSWAGNDRVFAPSTHRERKLDDYIKLQELRWEAAKVIDSEFSELLQFVSPSKGNFKSHSPRISMLFIKVCVEIESCFKSILSKNSVSNNRQKNIGHFSMVEQSHSLSKFSVRIHGWHQQDQVFRPFEAWACEPKSSDMSVPSLPWYSAYGSLKHNILETEKYGTFENLCYAICGLHALLVSQFGLNGWGPNRGSIGWHHAPEFECVIGDVVEVRFPKKDECRVVYDLPRTWEYEVKAFDYR